MPTSRPIVRTGTTPEFWKNWDNVFGDKPKQAKSTKTGSKASKTGAARKAGTKKAAAKKKSATKSTARRKATKK